MTTTRVAVLVCGLALMAGCAGDDDADEGTLAMDSSMAADTGMMGMPAMAGAAQDADHEFLRMMIDHHEGLVVIAGEATTRAADDSVRAAAEKLHQKQRAGQDTMVAMVQRMYGEQHQPSIMPKNAAQADTLRQRSGAEADRYFLETTIAHHQEGMEMIDRFMPSFTRPEVRQMAEGMREEQRMEIEELQGKLSSL